MWSVVAREVSSFGVRACVAYVHDNDPLVVRQDLPRPAAERHVAQDTYGWIVRFVPHLLPVSSTIKGPLERSESIGISG